MGFDHIRDVQLAVKIFLREVLEYIGGNDLARKLQDLWLDDLLEHKVELVEIELEKLLSFQEEPPMTFNPAFQRKIVELFSKKAPTKTLITKFEDKRFLSAAQTIEPLKSAGELYTTRDSDWNAAEPAFDAMQIHYQVSCP